MIYISPFSLPGIENAGSIPGKKELLLAKKRLLAEIDLGETQTIKINETEFTKDGILKLFDQFDDKSALEFHRLVAKDKAFLAFLEKGFISDHNSIQQRPEYGTPEFLEFISPFFRARYEPELNSLFRKKDFIPLIKLLQLKRFMTDEDEEACFRKVYEAVNESIDMIAELNNGIRSNKILEVPAEVTVCYSRNYLSAISLFPEFFMELRNRFAQQLIVLYVDCFNVLKRPEISGEIIRNLFSLKVDEEMRQEIRKREEEYKRASGSSSQGSSSGGAPGVRAIIWVLVIAVKVLILSRACGGNRHHDYSYLTRNSWNNHNTHTAASENENRFAENEENKLFFSFLDSLYTRQSQRGKKAIPLSGKSKLKSGRIYADILKHGGFFSGKMKDTAELVLQNGSGYELCVILSVSSGASAWHIPPGDSAVIRSQDKGIKVYYTSGRNLTLGKKYKALEYDNNLGHYKRKTIGLKVFKESVADAGAYLASPQTFRQNEIYGSAGSSTDNFLYKRLAAGGAGGIFKFRKILVFSDEDGTVSMKLREESRLLLEIRASSPANAP